MKFIQYNTNIYLFIFHYLHTSQISYYIIYYIKYLIKE